MLVWSDATLSSDADRRHGHTARVHVSTRTHLSVALVKEVVVWVGEDELFVAELCALEPRVFEVERPKLGPPLCVRSELVEVVR